MLNIRKFSFILGFFTIVGFPMVYSVTPSPYYWDTWSSWSFCNESEVSATDSCVAIQNRTRSCWDTTTVPSPTLCYGECSNGNVAPNCTCTSFCSGQWEEQLPCNLDVDGGWSGWTISSCSVTCGTGQITYTRSCDNPAQCNGGSHCEGNATEAVPCFEPPVDGGWSEWGNWSSCSVTIGEGYSIRERECDNPPTCEGVYCVGVQNESMACEAPSPYYWDTWSSWSFCNESEVSVTDPCVAIQNRTRSCWDTTTVPSPTLCYGECSNGNVAPNCTCKSFCSGQWEEHLPCNLDVDGGWSGWTISSCSVTCGTGQITYTRSCDNPAQCNGGSHCEGNATEAVPCIEPPVDGGWSEWGNWSSCSVTVGEGYKIRERECDNPPTCEGVYCVGVQNESMACEVIPPCFSSHVLDPQYASSDSAMNIYIPVNVPIFPTLQVARGTCDTPINLWYEWKLYIIDNSSGNETYLETSDQPKFTFRPSEVGLFKLHLKVHQSPHSTLWLADDMYIDVIYPPPNAAIQGGSGRSLGEGVHTIDGATLSYDLTKGPGENENLDFQYACTPIQIGSMYDSLNIDLNEELLFSADSVATDTFVNHTFVVNWIDDLLLVSNISLDDFLGSSPIYGNFCSPNATFNSTFILIDSILLNEYMLADIINFIDIVESRITFYNQVMVFEQYSFTAAPDIVNAISSWTVTMGNGMISLNRLKSIVRSINSKANRGDPVCESKNQLYGEVPGLISSVTQIDWQAYALDDESLSNRSLDFIQSQLCSNFEDKGRGIGELTITTTDINNNVGFIVTLKASANQSSSYFQQRIKAIEGRPFVIDIECRLNCFQKVASTSILSLRAECTSCSLSELSTVEYTWNVYNFSENTRQTSQFPNLQTVMETDLNNTAFVMKPHSLLTDSSYIVEVNITHLDNSSSTSIVILKTDLPPYGGSYEVKPGSGIAGVTMFQIEYEGWKDEGFREKRTPSLDWKESIFYRVFSRKGSDAATLLYHGNERDVSVLLPEGDPTDNYNLELLFRIYDVFGDYKEESGVFQVYPPIRNVTEPLVTSFISTTDANIDDAVQTGNPKKVTMSVENAASVISDLDLPVSSVPSESGSLVVTSTLSENETGYNWDTLWADYVNPPSTNTRDNLSSVTEEYSSILYETTKTEEGSGMVTIKHLAQGVGSIVQDPTLVGTSVADTAVTTNDLILTMFINSTADDDYPLFEDYEATSESILRVADNVLNGVLPSSSPNDMTTTDVYSIHQTIRTSSLFSSQDGGNITEMERAFLASQISKSQQLQLNTTNENARRFVPDVLDSLSTLGVVLKGMVYLKQLPVYVDRPGISTSMEQLTIPDLLKQPVTRNNITMEFSNSHDSSRDTKDVQISIFSKNPFRWDSESQYITSDVLTVSVKGTDDVEANLSVKVKFPNKGSNEEKTVYLAFPADTDEVGLQTFFHKFYWQFPNDDANFKLTGMMHGMKFTVYMKAGSSPTSSEYNWRYEVPDKDITGEDFLVVVPGGFFTQPTTTYFAVHVVTVPGTVTTRVRRSTSNANDTASNSTNIVTYRASVWTTGCRVWNDAEQKWDKTACQISTESTALETVCECNDPPGHHFATTFYVPPNAIDFDSVFNKFSIVDNGAVLGAIAGVLVLYLALAVWAWRQDRRDQERWAISYMVDNKEEHSYFYLVTVYTGLAHNAGTSSRVYMAVTSNRRDTGIRLLDDGSNKGFGTGSMRKFVMCVPKHLGNLTGLDIWHDNSGKGDSASWLLSKVEIMDLQSMERFTFICDQWLSLDSEDGVIHRALPVTEDLDSFGFRFNDNSWHTTSDKHLWLSVFLRPEDSNFTRLQRLSCCLALLFMAMISSAMFYRTDNGQNQVMFGPFTFSLNGLYISFMSTVISATPIFLITFLFQRSKKKETVEKMNEKTINKFANLPDIAQVEDYTRLKQRHKEGTSFKLPYWFIYVSWGLIICCVLVPGFFVMLYSMEWGKAKSEEWLLCFFLSIFQSIFVTDPVKVFVIAVILSYFFRKRSVDNGAEMDIQKISEDAKTHAAINQDAKCTVTEHPTTNLGRELVEKMKEQRQKELKAKHVFLELFCYALFLVVLYLISFSNRDSRSFQMRKHIDYQILQSPLANSSSDTLHFDKIITTDDFYTWMQDTLLPFVFPVTGYSGIKLTASQKTYIRDQQNFRIGPVRLRQLRVKSSRCLTPLTSFHTCYEEYKIPEEDTTDYCMGWKDGPCPSSEILNLSYSSWKFTSSFDLWGVPSLGDYSIYGGGGYVAELGVNYDVSMQTIAELKDNSWIDRGTRGVLVEFTLYNSNINLFTYISLLIEFPDTGGTSQYSFVKIFRTYQHLGGLGTFIFLCEVIFLISIIVCFVKMVNSLCKLKCKVFKDRWQILNWACVLLTITGIAMYAARWIFTNMTIEKFKENKYKFVNFGHIAVWDEVLNTFLSFVVFLATIRLMQVLNYNQRITQLTAALSHCAKDLLGCSLIFGIVFFAYVGVGYLLFGRVLATYRNILLSMTTITNALIGRNSITSLMETTPILAQFYYVTFVFFVMWVLMTMINATLNNSINTVRHEQQRVPVPYGIHDLALGVFREFITFLRAHQYLNKQNDQKSTDCNLTDEQNTVIMSDYEGDEKVDDIETKEESKDLEQKNLDISDKFYV